MNKSVSPIKRALLALEDMQAKLDAIEYAKKEPIAIIGMGCRFPGGADNPEAFWQLLRDGVDAITEVPPDRWDIEKYYDPDPDTPGKICTRKGGFLAQVDAFNPEFFGISAREAVSIDPQQRLLLEVSWEAIENASQPPEHLYNSSTGVFIGIYLNDYSKVMSSVGDVSQIDAFSAIGNSLAVAAGRLSYTLGLKGPTMAVDTSCSSSLVAVHLACQSLRLRESHLALAGGVGLNLMPDTSIALSKSRMLNPDGRCQTFDAAANGFVKGEGCGVIVLKRLSDALADKDNILAVIRGSAVNHNGRSSSLIAPNGLSQQAAIRQALENSGVEPSQVDYVEVQGTGTSVGEPIELAALGAVFGDRPQDKPLVIGSVKTNIGHLEPAAGIASLIKVALALQHGEIPPHLHFQQPNPYVNWDELAVKVPTKLIPWPAGKPRFAGVNTFGFSGTNAFVVLEAAPVSEPVTKSIERPMHLLALSAKTDEALIQLAERYQKHLLANPDLDLGDICFTANSGRSHFQHRLSVVASSSTELCEKLAAFCAGRETAGVFQGKATDKQGYEILDISSVEKACLNPHLGKDEWQQLLENLATSYVRGAKIDWLSFDKHYSRQRLQLPTYPWQRKRYWFGDSNYTHSFSHSNGQSSTVKFLGQVDIKQLIEQLEINQKLSQQEKNLLPGLLELLTKQYHSQSIQQINPRLLTAADIQAWLVEQIAKELGVKPEDINAQVPFDSYGLDSVLAIGIASAGKQFLGLDVSPILLVHYPTIESLAQHLAKQLETSESEIFEI